MRICSISSINKNTSFKSQKPVIPVDNANDLAIFGHHLYEYRTGLRNLVLTKAKATHKDIIINRLKEKNIDYVVHQIDGNKYINVYFGAKECIDVVKSFNQPVLKKYTPEQDFMLGIMLGYDRLKECKRYLDILSGKIKLG